MFNPNATHSQGKLFGATVLSLSKEVQNYLKKFLAKSFYTNLFCKIDESKIQILYSDKKLHPNISINILVGLEILKSGHWWSDKEMHEAFLFNLKV